MEAATNRPMWAFNISKVSYAWNLGRFGKCVLYLWPYTRDRPKAGYQAEGKEQQHADKRLYTNHSDINEGDTVLVKKDAMLTKAFTPYEIEPFIVDQRKGTVINASNPDGRNVTRSSSFFRKVQISEDISGEDDWEPPIRDQQEIPKPIKVPCPSTLTPS